MSDRSLPREELQASRNLDRTLVKYLPGILETLPANVIRTVTDRVYDRMGAPGGKVPIEIILRKKYEILLAGGHIKPFTTEQIAAASRDDSKEELVGASNGTGPDDTGMVV